MTCRLCPRIVDWMTPRWRHASSAQATELLPVAPIDVSAAFAGCDSAMVRRGLDEHGHAMHGIVLPGFHGLLGTKRTDVEGAQLPRLGRELAAAAKLAGVAGVFHSDELPAYGITENDLTSARDALSAGSEDAIVLCLAPAWQADLALESVVLRARTAFGRIPQEVRNVVVRNGLPEDGTTQAMRPLPSGARMYPETDIRPLHLTPDHWSAALMRIPPDDRGTLGGSRKLRPLQGADRPTGPPGTR